MSSSPARINPAVVGFSVNQRDPIASDLVLAALSNQLHELQLAQIAHGRRAIILFEGPEGSGKKTALRQLAAAFDPCHYAVHHCSLDRRQASQGHWLAPFWAQLPTAGNTTIFFRSWYRRVLDDRLSGRVETAAVARAFDEINEFEAQQRDSGTLIVKLFFTVSTEVQKQRLEQGSSNPWRRPRREEPMIVSDPAYAQAFADLRTNSDTRWSPWKLIEADDEGRATLAALESIAEAWSQTMPAEPPELMALPPRVA